MPARVSAPAELVLDVSASVPFDESICVAALVHLPDLAAGAPRATLVCWPGGSYSRAYWDMHIPQHSGYSFADHLTAQGYLVVAADHLGVGASSKPADGDRVNLETMSAACASFVEQVRGLLAEGAPELGGIRSRNSPSSASATRSAPASRSSPRRGIVATTPSRCWASHMGKRRCRSPLSVPLQPIPTLRAARSDRPPSSRRERSSQTPGTTCTAWCHASPTMAGCIGLTCPPTVVAADDAEAVRWPRQSYVDALLVGYSAGFAAQLDCSVFVGFGDHDVPPVPHHDVAFYTGSDDVTLYILPDAAHCHNFATTRTQLWDRISLWAAGLTIA